VHKFWNRIDALLLWLTGAAAIACALHVSLDVALKYLFAAPIPGTINIVSNYYMIILVFAPLAMAELRNAHISVDILPLPPGRAGDIWMRCIYILNGVVFAAVAYNTFVDAWKKYEVRAFALDQNGLIYIWPGYFVLPLGLGLISILLICKAVRPDLAVSDDEVIETHG